MPGDDNVDRPHFAGFMTIVQAYTGDEDSFPIKHFFEGIEQVGSVAKWNEQDKLLIAKHKLKGIAQEHLNKNHSLWREDDYNRFKSELITYFHQREPITSTLQKLSSCYQKPGESVRDFATRLKALTDLSYSTTEATTQESKNLIDRSQLAYFLGGLTPKIQRFVLSSNCKTFQEAYEKALLEETNELTLARSLRVNSADSQPTTQSTAMAAMAELFNQQNAASQALVNALQEQVATLTDRLQKLEVKELEPRPEAAIPRPPRQSHRSAPDFEDRSTSGVRNRPTQITGAIKCFRCHGDGHYARVCPTGRSDNRPRYTGPNRTQRQQQYNRRNLN